MSFQRKRLFAESHKTKNERKQTNAPRTVRELTNGIAESKHQNIFYNGEYIIIVYIYIRVAGDERLGKDLSKTTNIFNIYIYVYTRDVVAGKTFITRSAGNGRTNLLVVVTRKTTPRREKRARIHYNNAWRVSRECVLRDKLCANELVVWKVTSKTFVVRESAGLICIAIFGDKQRLFVYDFVTRAVSDVNNN